MKNQYKLRRDYSHLTNETSYEISTNFISPSAGFRNFIFASDEILARTILREFKNALKENRIFDNTKIIIWENGSYRIVKSFTRNGEEIIYKMYLRFSPDDEDKMDIEGRRWRDHCILSNEMAVAKAIYELEEGHKTDLLEEVEK
jgi:hypothetical protein